MSDVVLALSPYGLTGILSLILVAGCLIGIETVALTELRNIVAVEDETVRGAATFGGCNKGKVDTDVGLEGLTESSYANIKAVGNRVAVTLVAVNKDVDLGGVTESGKIVAVNKDVDLGIVTLVVDGFTTESPCIGFLYSRQCIIRNRMMYIANIAILIYCNMYFGLFLRKDQKQNMDYLLLFINLGLLVLYLVILFWFDRKHIMAKKSIQPITSPSPYPKLILPSSAIIPQPQQHNTVPQDPATEQLQAIRSAIPKPLEPPTTGTTGSTGSTGQVHNPYRLKDTVLRSFQVQQGRTIPQGPGLVFVQSDEVRQPFMDELTLEDNAYNTPPKPLSDRSLLPDIGESGIKIPTVNLDPDPSQLLTPEQLDSKVNRILKPMDERQNPSQRPTQGILPFFTLREPQVASPTQAGLDKSDIIESLRQKYPNELRNVDLYVSNYRYKQFIYELFAQPKPYIRKPIIDDIVTRLLLDGISTNESLRRSYTEVLLHYLDNDTWVEANKEWLDNPCDQNKTYKPLQLPSGSIDALQRLREAIKCDKNVLEYNKRNQQTKHPESATLSLVFDSAKSNKELKKEEEFNRRKEQLILELNRSQYLSNNFLERIYDLFATKVRTRAQDLAVPGSDIDAILTQYLGAHKTVIVDNNIRVMLRFIYTKVLECKGLKIQQGDPLKPCDESGALFKKPSDNWLYKNNKAIKAIVKHLLCRNEPPQVEEHHEYDGL